MKHLIKYNESDNTSSDSYVQLLDTLMNVFDDYNVISYTQDHEYESSDNWIE